MCWIQFDSPKINSKRAISPFFTHPPLHFGHDINFKSRLNQVNDFNLQEKLIKKFIFSRYGQELPYARNGLLVPQSKLGVRRFWGAKIAKIVLFWAKQTDNTKSCNMSKNKLSGLIRRGDIRVYHLLDLEKGLVRVSNVPFGHFISLQLQKCCFGAYDFTLVLA